MRRNRMMKTTASALMAACLIAAPAYAAETEADLTAMTEAEAPVLLHGDTECELEDGIYTIRIQALDTDDPAFGWQSYRGDKGDASLTDCLTETDMEDGLAYAGSFMGVKGETGEDTIRIVHTNGFYVDGYLDFIVQVEDGKITEEVGGGEGYGATGEDLAPALAGTWEAEDGSFFMEVAVSQDNALDFTISEAGGTNGETTYYTMTAYYDCIKSALLYQNGAKYTAAITDGSETEAEPAKAVEENGTGVFGFFSKDGENITICWQDNTFGNTEIRDFRKAE